MEGGDGVTNREDEAEQVSYISAVQLYTTAMDSPCKLILGTFRDDLDVASTATAHGFGELVANLIPFAVQPHLLQY